MYHASIGCNVHEQSAAPLYRSYTPYRAYRIILFTIMLLMTHFGGSCGCIPSPSL